MGGGFQYLLEYCTCDWQLGVPVVLTHVPLDASNDMLEEWGFVSVHMGGSKVGDV